MRSKFNKHLPDPSCIRAWISNCTGVGESGICTESLKSLEMLAKKMKENGKSFYCSLAFDEMHIRKNVQWNEAKKKFIGFITYGKQDKNGEIPVAKQALVFLANGINIKISIPVAHFFIDGLSGAEKAFLLKEILRELTKIDVRVINITFDGYTNNFTTCTLLGASFKLEDLKPYIINPFDKTKIYISLDICHMLKLTRNCLGDEKVLEDGNGQLIEWKFFENLEKYRVERNLVVHKITKKHIQWNRNKMNVKLAAQLYSKSVADSLLYLSNQNCYGFEGCETTSKFSLMMNNLFDVFNSTGASKNPFKTTLTRDSAGRFFALFDEASKYLKSMKLNGRNLLQTKRKTGFKGFLINIISLKCIFETYVETGLIEEISTYQLSQDSLESLFSRVRSMNGCADNPTVSQFTSAFRKILINNEITSSELANCADKLNILTVSSRRGCQQNQNRLSEIVQHPVEESDCEFFESITINENDFLMDCCEEVTIASIVGFIENKIEESGRFACSCVNVLQRNEKVSDLTIGNQNITPCLSTLYVCKIANICFNQCRSQIDFDYDALISKVMEIIDFSEVFVDYFECEESHKLGFMKYFVEEFIRIQATYIAKNITLIEQKIMCRKYLNKKIHFLGQ